MIFNLSPFVNPLGNWLVSVLYFPETPDTPVVPTVSHDISPVAVFISRTNAPSAGSPFVRFTLPIIACGVGGPGGAPSTPNRSQVVVISTDDVFPSDALA